MITSQFYPSEITDTCYFYDAYATYTGNEDDQLTVYASTDAGITYNSGILFSWR